MLVKTRIPHETKLPSVVQVPYSCTFVKITTVHVRIRFDGALDSHKYGNFAICCTGVKLWNIFVRGRC